MDETFPLIDLHRHLDGSVRLQTILDLGREHNLPLPAFDSEELRPYVQVTEPQPGIMAFLARFEWMGKILVNYDACRRIAYENIEDALKEGIDYIELRFSPWFMAEPYHLNPAAVVEAVVDGVAAGVRDFGIKAKLIGILSRTYGADLAWQELDALLKYRDHIVALDLAGDEANWPGNLFVKHFQKGRDNGWYITIHAGEADGPQSIWQAIRDLGATRIGHATRSIEDPSLLDYLAQHRIGVESNITSNVQTMTVTNYPNHPLRLFLEHGILATINTDDPGISGIDLLHEYQIAAPAAGLSPQQIIKAQHNSLEIAFLSPEDKQELVKCKQ